MTVAITKNQGNAVATTSNRGIFDDQQIAILKSSYAKQLDNIEFKVFLETAAALKLNPFSREIYAIKYGNIMSLVTSIDGYRKLSARSGKFMGVTNGRLRVKSRDGQSITIDHEVYDPDEHTIISATIGIRVKDWPEPVEATAVFKTYKKDQPNWKLMPDVMILKCAEAAAHRKAALLPDLGVFSTVAPIYVEEEIQDITDYRVVDVQPEPPTTIPKDYKPSTKHTPKDSIVEKMDIPVKPVKKEEPKAEVVEPEEVAEKELTEAEKMLEKIMSTYREWGSNEDGIVYAENRILAHFDVSDPSEITDIKELRRYCAKDLKAEMQQESFLPLPRPTEED